MTAEQPTNAALSLELGDEQPLVGIVVERNGKERVRYSTDDAVSAKASPDDGIQAALNLAGAWSDLDWDETLTALDLIRHENKPTPPIISL